MKVVWLLAFASAWALADHAPDTPAAPAAQPQGPTLTEQLERLERWRRADIATKVERSLPGISQGLAEQIEGTAKALKLPVNGETPEALVSAMEAKLKLETKAGEGLAARWGIVRQTLIENEAAEKFAKEYGDPKKMTVAARTEKLEAFLDARQKEWRDKARKGWGDGTRLGLLRKMLPDVASQTGGADRQLSEFEKEFSVQPKAGATIAERLSVLEPLVEERFVVRIAELRKKTSIADRVQSMYSIFE